MTESAKKVLFVWDNLTVYGGVRTFLLSGMRFLPEKGYQVHLLDLHDGPVVLDDEAEAFGSNISLLPHHAWDSEQSFERRLFYLVADQQPDVVVFVEWRHAEDVIRCLPQDVPIINFCLVDRPDRRYYQYAADHAERVSLILGNSYFITHRLRETLDEQYHHKISELFIGVHVPGKWKMEQPADQPLQLIYMSRLNQDQKRARDLVPFCQGLEASGVDFRLTIVGDGDERDYIERELEPIIRAGQAEMTGSLAFPEAIERFTGKDVFLLLSAYEGMPLVLLHALAAGAVPVVTDVQSGVSEILDDGENGLLFPVGNPGRAVEIIKELDGDRLRLFALRQAARSLGEKNSIRITMVEFEKRLQQIFRNTLPENCWSAFSLPASPGANWRERLAFRLPRPVLKWMGYRQ